MRSVVRVAGHDWLEGGQSCYRPADQRQRDLEFLQDSRIFANSRADNANKYLEDPGKEVGDDLGNPQ